MAEIAPSGAQYLAPGIAQAPWTSGRYYFVPNDTTTAAAATLGNGFFRAVPVYVPTGVTLSRIGGEVTSGGDVGSKLRIGVYADDGTGRPGALVIDAGTIAGDSATVQEIIISQAIAPGIYWFGAAVQLVTVTQPTLRILTGPLIVPLDAGSVIPTAGAAVSSIVLAGVTGALPGSLAAASPTATVSPRLFVKVA